MEKIDIIPLTFELKSLYLTPHPGHRGPMSKQQNSSNRVETTKLNDLKAHR